MSTAEISVFEMASKVFDSPFFAFAPLENTAFSGLNLARIGTFFCERIEILLFFLKKTEPFFLYYFLIFFLFLFKIFYFFIFFRYFRLSKKAFLKKSAR